ncbi:glycosyltransferase family 4 protein [Marinobacter mobilis]|uniref:glycosyltransferase family 4 protein n=1 Tax=Marinobacter mobilis TaxID=488533 RepID=UPI0035C66AC4
MTGTKRPGQKILAIHRYYWPDSPPYASMLRAMVQRWVQDGHQVDVLSSQPSYKAELENEKQPGKEQVDGATVYRLTLPSEAGRPLMRMVNALRLGLGILVRAVLRRRYDVIMVSTSPPVLAGWFTALAARLSGARFVYHCMDIHPEIGRISGEFRNPTVYRVLERLDKWSCRQANPVVVLSEDMAESLTVRASKELTRTVVINNFSLPAEPSSSADLPFPWPEEAFVLLFAGNLGRFQGLGVLMDAMALLRDHSEIRLLMMGEGTERAALEQRAAETGARVTFVGHHPVAVAKKAMKQAGAGFVSLVPELYRFAYPSKTMTYLEQGCPVLVAVEPESCLARDIMGNGAGLAVQAGDAEKLAQAIVRLADDREGVRQMKENALALAILSYSPEVVLARWAALIDPEKKSR